MKSIYDLIIKFYDKMNQTEELINFDNVNLIKKSDENINSDKTLKINKSTKKNISPKKIIQKAKDIKGGDILVFHDSEKGFPNLKNSIIEIIEQLKSRGLKFKTL
jgi:CRISPR/Cas system-associated endonuclease Cas3-HD